MLSPAVMLRRLLRVLGNPGGQLLRPMPSSRAQVMGHTSGSMNQGNLDLGSQAECLLDALARVVDTQQRTLLLLCPEWNAVTLVQTSSAPSLEYTELPLSSNRRGELVALPQTQGMSSPILQWIQSHDAAINRWDELVVLPQFQGVSPQERGFFEGLETELLVPLRVDGSLTGILLLGTKSSGDAYRREELDLIARIASAAARSIENARLYAVEQTKVAELDLSNQMKSEYVLAISHQLKTPIAAVKASAEMLRESQAELPELRHRLVNSIVRGADSLDRLVTELTEYGKMQRATLELNKEESDLSSIVADTCVLLQPLVDDKGIRLHVEAPSTLPPVVMDPHRVQQILSNLIANAIKFSPAGGEITVRVRLDGDRLLTQVQDNGPGITEAHQRWVFEAFYLASDATNGTNTGSGLGLAIAKALTELHGGTIWVESQEGKGSIFSFTLPLRS